MLQKASNGAYGQYHEFASDVIAVANAAEADPVKNLTSAGGVSVIGGKYGGSSAPGGRFVTISTADGGVIGGNQFYPLKSP